MYLEVKKQDAFYESKINGSKQGTRDAFREWNNTSMLPLTYLEVLKEEQRCHWRFNKLTKRKRVSREASLG